MKIRGRFLLLLLLLAVLILGPVPVFPGIGVEQQAAEADSQKEELPLVEVPALPGQEPVSDVLAVLLTGDGGWAELDKAVASILAAHGVSVVGLNSLHYFWKARTPDQASADLEKILLQYLALWEKRRVALIGYSRGADVLPFIANRLPQSILAKTILLALLGPGRTAAFEFHVADWVHASSSAKGLPIQPELEKLRGLNILCFYGEQERDSLCTTLEPGFAKCFPLPGAHHFGGRYAVIAETILREIPNLGKGSRGR